MEVELSKNAGAYVAYLIPGMFANIGFCVFQKYLQSQVCRPSESVFFSPMNAHPTHNILRIPTLDSAFSRSICRHRCVCCESVGCERIHTVQTHRIRCAFFRSIYSHRCGGCERVTIYAQCKHMKSVRLSATLCVVCVCIVCIFSHVCRMSEKLMCVGC